MADRGRAVTGERPTGARLNAAALAGLAPGDGLVLPDPAALNASVGLVHLGIGAFHRAHQALYTEDAATAAGDSTWGICGVTQRSAGVRDQLAPQDGLYGALVRAPGTTRLRITGAVREVLLPTDQAADVTARFADPAVRVVSLTVTEKGYRRAPDGSLDLTHADVAADLAGAGAPRSSVGRLVRGLQARMRADAGPVTVLCCDNLPANGRVLSRLVDDFCAALPTREGDELAAWLATSVTFPSSMVDRIVPATTPEDVADARAITGLEDHGLVVTEDFGQWVIEDRFAAARPAWERAGAEFTADVEPYEAMKLRILNGSHSTLAYLGALAGHETIAQTVADDRLREIAEHLVTEDVIPTLAPAGDTDLPAYGRQILQRYTNPGLRHRTVQIAMDGSQKLPQRLLGTVRDRLAAHEHAPWATLGVAAWMAYVASERDAEGRELPLDDPLADRLGAVRGNTDPAAVVDDLLTVREVFGTDLPDHTVWRDDLVAAVGDLLAAPVAAGGRTTR
ncbi:mannitol dehydrogenase family protein [Tersicoccus sp. MR15.9]|uniref:mannitol dehydrogenase family protein n=1 Tax=Tersicoccus mangrovi TaxID=3121635 RepID=UPI002FE5CDD8